MKISFIIPTIDRSQELQRLLQSFLKQTRQPDEIIVVEQGTGTAEKMIADFADLQINYFKVDFKSLTKARNFALKKTSGEIISFLDDDIVLEPNYVEKLVEFFDKHPQALGVQGLITNFAEGHRQKVGGSKLVYKIYNIFAKIFLLNNSSDKNKLLISGRNQYASQVASLENCQWLSGIGNYRRQVFSEFAFDENLQGYALGEDKLFSYPIFEKYPHSLYLDPKIKCEHHHASYGRPQGKDWVEMKINYTYYLWQKLFKSKGFLAYLSYFWANLGDLIIVFISVILRENKFKFWWWHVCGYMKVLLYFLKKSKSTLFNM